MSRTRIFVSSTFFDLAQVREDIRAAIIQLGHEPLLNEYPSFPVSPDLDTVENCRKAVKESDFFVLIVGGRRGSLDPVSGKSVTNVEYETAIQNDITCFVFVHERIMTLLPVWQKNPEADFTPSVDSPHVFDFVEKIKTTQKWIFTFGLASEISEILRNQLSVFLKNLLDRKRTGRLDPVREFSLETEKARQLVLDRPRLWEYLLTEELLRSKLSAIKREYEDLEKGLIFRSQKTVGGMEYSKWLLTKADDIRKIAQVIQVVVEKELPDAWGKPGEPGNAMQILRAVNKVIEACKALLEWELDLQSTCPPAALRAVGATLRGVTTGIIDELTRMPEELSSATGGQWTGVREVEIKLAFKLPPQFAKFEEELAKVVDHPDWLT